MSVDLLHSVRSLGDIGSCSMLLFRNVLSQRCLCFAPMLCVALSINIYHFEVHFVITSSNSRICLHDRPLIRSIKKMAGWMDGLQTSFQEQLALVMGEGQGGNSIFRFGPQLVQGTQDLLIISGRVTTINAGRLLWLSQEIFGGVGEE